MNFITKDYYENQNVCDQNLMILIYKLRLVLNPNSENIYDKTDIENNPQKYLPAAITICQLTEKLRNKCPFYIKSKKYNFFPIPSMMPKYVPLDTKTLHTLFLKDDKYKDLYASDVNLFATHIWKTCFPKISKYLKKGNNYIFDESISTNGYCVSIRMIKNIYKNDNDNFDTQGIKSSKKRT